MPNSLLLAALLAATDCPRPAAAAGPPPVEIFAYDRRAPLALRDSVDRVERGIAVHRVSFDSPKGGRASGWLHVPPDALRGRGGRFAGIVLLHGAPGNAAGMGFAAEPLAEAGAVVLTIDAPFARRDPQKPVSFTPQDSSDAVQYVVDLQRAVDVLAARADVDTARLGAVGISYGGAVGALLAGVERRLKAYVLAVGDGGLAARYTSPTGDRLPPPPGMSAAQWCRWYDALEPLAATRFVSRAAPARLLFLWGRQDPFVHPRLADALWRAAPETKEALWYESGHALPMASGDDQRRWLATQLGLTAPPAFRRSAAEHVGTYAGWGDRIDPVEVRVVADSAGRLSFLGPFTGPDDPTGRLSYLGPAADGEVFRFYDKRLTFVRRGAGGPVTALRMDVPIDDPKVHLVFERVAPAAPAGAAARVRAALDSVAESSVGRGRAAGFVVLAVRGRDTLAARAYGRADVENDAPMTADHVFQLASITKQFTAAAVLTLVDSGLVALDAPITRYLPDAPVRDPSITVRQLLSHTAGLPDYAESPRVRTIKRLDLPPDSLLALIRGTAPYFAAGEQMRYSNTGFVLLGQLVERVTGRPYAAYVEERVLRPAGATRAHFCAPERLVPRVARGYALGAQGLRPAAYISPHAPWAAGGFCGTAGDLTAWNLAVHARQGGSVLSPQRHADMTRPGTIGDGRRTRYGLGLQLGELAGRRVYAHGGDIDGFTTYTAYLPDDSLSVTVLVNTQGPTRPDAVAAAVVGAALGAVTEPAPAVPAPRADELAPLAGAYDGGEVVFATATDGAGRPTLRLTRGPLPAVLLRPTGRGPEGWTFTDGRARYTFEVRATRSPAVWADLGVALVRWERAR
jgi:uncharacterized protein